MNSFEKLFVNSTNRISATKNIVISTQDSHFSSLRRHNHHNLLIQKNNNFTSFAYALEESTETLEQLQMKYQELTKIVKEANKEKQMMQDLIDMIFKVEKGEEEKMKKRIRRKKNQLQSKYECNISTCKKIYSSSASLVRHNKLKHGYTKLEPPSHNYLIPPSPNLTHPNTENRSSDMKETFEKDGDDSEEEGAANKSQKNEDLYEADCEQESCVSEEFDDDD